MASTPVLAIGWDVGGWRGTRHGLAAISVAGDGQLRAHCRARARAVWDWPEAAGLEAVVSFASDGLASTVSHRVVLGIDAPFGFPAPFRRLLGGESHGAFDLGSLQRNPYAFRETDRSINERFKMPLSAAFDKLGNNATVAMHFLAGWRRAGLRVLPFDVDDGTGPVAIEVYPAVAGPRLGAAPSWLSRMCEHLPVGVRDAHQMDALICAGLALSYALPDHQGFPKLLPPPGGLPEGEGWIWAPEQPWTAHSTKEDLAS